MSFLPESPEPSIDAVRAELERAARAYHERLRRGSSADSERVALLRLAELLGELLAEADE